MSVLVGVFVGLLIAMALVVPAALVFIRIEEETDLNYHEMMMAYCGFWIVVLLVLLWFFQY